MVNVINGDFQEDPTTRRWLQQLLLNVQAPRVAMQAGGGFDLMVN